jgi:GH24 family phage-related lysozyme (muramidase)
MEPMLVKPAVSREKAVTKARVLDLPYDEIYTVIRKHEGFRAKPYLDTKKKWTVGVGTLIGDGSDQALAKSPFKGRAINETEARDIAMAEMRSKAELAASDQQLGESFTKMSPKLQAQIISGYYRGDISGSPKTKQLLKSMRFAEAADEFLNNEEYRQAKKSGSGVAARMEEVAEAMREEDRRKGFLSAVEGRLSR